MSTILEDTTTTSEIDPTIELTTDLRDYAPGATAVVTASQVTLGGTIEFEVEHVTSAGDDGLYGTADDVTEDFGGLGHEPWIVTDGGAGDLDGLENGTVVTNWYVNPDDSAGATFLLTAQEIDAGTDGQVGTSDDVAVGSRATHSFTDAGLIVDFRQAANNAGEPGGLGDIDWRSSILQTGNSVYREGMSVMQRIVLENYNDADNDGNVTLNFSTDATKAGNHAYDWLTSWDQAITAAANAGVAFDNTQVDPNQNLLHAGTETNLTVAEASDGALGPPNTLPADVIEMLTPGGNGQVFYIDVVVPDDPFLSKDSPTQARIDAYEALYGNRTIRVYSNQAMNGGTLTLTHDVANGGDTGDSTINYKLTVDFTGGVTSATQVMVEMAGHLAKSTDADGWGAGNGSSDISGGPYHFSLQGEDGTSLGSQDNQIKGADILPSNPGLNIVKDVSSVTGGTADAAGDVINYAISVQNTGDVKLTGVTVTDPFADSGSIQLVADAASADGELDVGETWHYTAAHTVTQAEIDSNGGGDGALENTATADSTQTGPDTDDATVPLVYNPALNIVKDVSSVTGGTADAAGDVINYAISVQNTGNTTLTGVVVTDPFADSGSIQLVADAASADGELDVGETWHYTAAHTILQSEIDSNGGGDGALENTATADSTQTGPDTDDATVPLVYNPALNIVKDVSSVTGGTADAAGDVINYAISVQNTGNTTLTGVVVTDPFADSGSIQLVADAASADGELDVGETWHYTAAHTILQSEIDSNGGGDGALENTATADSTQTGPDTDDATVPLVYNPALNIVKDVSSVTGGTADAAGDVINYAISVANTGNTTLTGVVVTDPFADSGSIQLVADAASADGELDVGETWHYTAAHTILQSEINSNGGGDGALENTATADSTQTGPDTDDATVPLVYNPDLTITKDAAIADGHADQVGDVIHYTVKVDNTGNVDLTHVVVTDTFEGGTGVVLDTNHLTATTADDASLTDDTHDFGVLNVDETWTYSYDHIVTQNELTTRGIDGDDSLDNVASVTTTQTGPDSDDAHIPVVLGPGVRTPGFWANTTWQKFWDGIGDNQPKQAGTNGFADGEITYRVDSNHNGIGGIVGPADPNDQKGLLIGDFDLDGLSDPGEHTLFISTADALTLLNASQKQQGDGRYMLGRDVVSSWLNYLAGNAIGDGSSTSAKDYIDDAAVWLNARSGSDGTLAISDLTAGKVATNSQDWQLDLLGLGHSPSQLHSGLDHYNNFGTV